MQITKTINPLPFAELETRRFEDLCLALIYPTSKWIEIRHYGRTGSDDGIDIMARERLENERERLWFIQCKRHSKISASKLKKAVDEAIDKTTKPPDVLLVIVSCDISKKAYEKFISYASEKRIGEPIIWTKSLLEARLFSERPDLLFAFFGISLAERSRQRETIIRRNIALKRQLMQDLLKPASERRQGEEPFARFNFRKAIIRSIDDSVYPEADIRPGQISGWFGVEIFSFYHNGLEFILNIENGIIDEYGCWDIVTEGETYDQSRFKKMRLWYLGRLPYRNIVDYDMLGDEFYKGPHFFCTFSDSGMPWEEFVYAPIDRPYERLKPDMRINQKAFLKVGASNKKISTKA